jgi:caffeoyl-CoA O-methyltransferase
MKKPEIFSLLLCLISFFGLFPGNISSQTVKENPAIDAKVKKFLSDHSGQWYDMNIPEADGQTLYNLILKGNYKSALEIGTSTGHSGIYIAWALSKTGGKLITIEVDEGRHKTALENFKQAGLSEYIDARLADAHSLVKELKGPTQIKTGIKTISSMLIPNLKPAVVSLLIISPTEAWEAVEEEEAMVVRVFSLSM